MKGTHGILASMPKKDYLMRYIEQMTHVIAHVLRLKQARQYDQAMAITNSTMRDLVGVGSGALLYLPTDDIVNRLQLQDDIGWEEKCVFIAAVLKEEGDIYLAQEAWDEGYGRYLKALELLLVVHAKAPDFDIPDAAPTVDGLLGQLTGIVLPEELTAGSITYYEQKGDYASAENMLFLWLETHPNSAEPVSTGITFYERLLTRNDDTLIAGDLPREEVEAGLTELLAEWQEA